MPPKRPTKAAATAPTPYRVFVSHATADKWIARTICEKIDAIPGVVTFRDDRDIAGGDTIRDVLLEELEQADEVLVLLTPTSVGRQWVIAEAAVGWALRKRIVPICYNATVDQIAILSGQRAFLLNDFDSYLADLRERVGEARR